MLFTVIGTQSHECGHALVAKWYGYKPRIGYAYTSYGDLPHHPRMDSLMRRHPTAISRRQYFPDSVYYWTEYRKGRASGVAITWGGPVQTMLTGSAGLVLMLAWWGGFRRARRLSAGQWMIVLVVLFWLRPLANFIAAMAKWIISGHLSTRSDEVRLAKYYQMPLYSFSITAAVLALMVFAIVYRAIPRVQRATFILAGAVGGVSGYLLWLEWLGPIVMPYSRYMLKLCHRITWS